MTKMVQIRNVPDDLHRRLKSRAATAGMSLSDYLLRELDELASEPTPEEIRARLAALTPIEPREAPADIIRAERDSR